MRFKRQFRIGPYVVDFCCPTMKVVVEVNRNPNPIMPPDAYDQMRVSYLEAAGYNVFQFAEEDVKDHAERVIAAIRSCIAASHPTN